jgi:hypothetical protein
LVAVAIIEEQIAQPDAQRITNLFRRATREALQQHAVVGQCYVKLGVSSECAGNAPASCRQIAVERSAVSAGFFVIFQV